MVISTKGRYALRLMIDLAQHCDEGFISLKTVSQRQDVSLKYMEAIAAALNREPRQQPARQGGRLPSKPAGERDHGRGGAAQHRGQHGRRVVPRCRGERL